MNSKYIILWHDNVEDMARKVGMPEMQFNKVFTGTLDECTNLLNTVYEQPFAPSLVSKDGGFSCYQLRLEDVHFKYVSILQIC